MPNFGLILEPIAPDTGFTGGPAGDLRDVLPTGDWEPFLPEYETQNKHGLETMNCVQFSRLNVCETQARFYKEIANFSDRFLGWSSGVTKKGNSYSICDYWLKHRGACAEGLWAWTDEATWEDYYVAPPQNIIDEAKKMLEAWDIGMLVYVSNNIPAFKAALKKTPIWFCDMNHSMMIYRVDDRIRVFDTYNGGKTSYPLSYASQIYAAYNAPFTPKALAPKPMISLPPNCLVLEIEGLGQIFANVDGTKLIKDDAGKMDLVLQARNSKECPESICEHCEPGHYVPHRRQGNVPTVTVKTEEIAHLPRVNLKGEPV